MTTQLKYFDVCEEDVFPSHSKTAPREGQTDRPIGDGTTTRLGDKVLPMSFSLDDAIEFANDERINGLRFGDRPLTNIEMYAIVRACRLDFQRIAQKWCDRLSNFLQSGESLYE